jgi:hypothetical protein
MKSLGEQALAVRLANCLPLAGLPLQAEVAPLPAHLSSRDELGDDSPYPARLRARLALWRAILRPDDPALRILESGLDLPLAGHPSPPPQSPIPRGSDISNEEVAEELQRLLRLQIVRLLSAEEARNAAFCNVFARRKPSGKIRLIYNAIPINGMLPEPPKLALPDLREARRIAVNAKAAAVADLTDAFYMIPLAARLHRLFAFRLGGTAYCFQMMPFGLSWAPYILQAFTNRLLAAAAIRTATGSTYVDDTFLSGSAFRKVGGALRRYVRVARALGFLVKAEKLQGPAAIVTYLGSIIDCDKQTVKLTDRRRANIHRLAGLLLKQLTSAPRSQIRRTARSLAGHLASATTLVSSAYTAIAPFSALQRAQHPRQRAAARLAAAHLSKDPLEEVPVTIDPDCQLFTDASDTRWGAVLRTPAHAPRVVSGIWPPAIRRLHINTKEVMAVTAALRQLNLQDTAVRICIDNRAALYATRSGGRTVAMQAAAITLYRETTSRRLRLIPTWVPTAANAADEPSRGLPLDASKVRRELPLFATAAELQRLAFIAPAWHPPSLVAIARSKDEAMIWRRAGIVPLSWAKRSSHLRDFSSSGPVPDPIA